MSRGNLAGFRRPGKGSSTLLIRALFPSSEKIRWIGELLGKDLRPLLTQILLHERIGAENSSPRHPDALHSSSTSCFGADEGESIASSRPTSSEGYESCLDVSSVRNRR